MKMPELQDILQQYGKQYKEKHNLPIYVKKTLNAIEKCRTAELGAHEVSYQTASDYKGASPTRVHYLYVLWLSSPLCRELQNQETYPAYSYIKKHQQTDSKSSLFYHAQNQVQHSEHVPIIGLIAHYTPCN